MPPSPRNHVSSSVRRRRCHPAIIASGAFLALCIVGMLWTEGNWVSDLSPLLLSSGNNDDNDGSSEDSNSAAFQQLQKELKRVQRQLDETTQQLRECRDPRQHSPPDPSNTRTPQDVRIELEQSEERQNVYEQQEDTQEDSRPSVHRHPICQQLSSYYNNNNDDTHESAIPTTAWLWTRSLAKIHAASQLLPHDPQYNFHDFTAHLLQLTSSRIPRSVQSLPRQWHSVRHIMDKAWARYHYLLPQQQQPSNTNTNNTIVPPPVKIVVMGGSLLQGTNCRAMVKDLHVPNIYLTLRQCSWAYRLEKFLHQLLLGNDHPSVVGGDDGKNNDDSKLVQVVTIAQGGTNTQSGTLILHHELLPPKAHHPDIFINAYATNDMHAWTMTEAGKSNATLTDILIDMMQDFVRNATTLNDNDNGDDECTNATQPPPLVIQWDDYVGNEQRDIVHTLDGLTARTIVSHYYGIPTISYAEVVRDWVYADTHESWFSPMGWYQRGRRDPNITTNPMRREIHPQMGAHIVSTWLVAYNVLHYMTTFCSLEPWWHVSTGNDEARDRASSTAVYRDDLLAISYHTSRHHMPQLPALRGDDQWVPKGKPEPLPPAMNLPPRLTPDLSLEDVSALWRANATRDDNQQQCGTANSSNAPRPPKCPFAWISRIRVVPLPNVTETQSHYKEQDAANAYMAAFSHDWGHQWKILNDHQKIGISPTDGVGSVVHVTLETNNAQTVTLFYMKSYGEKWANSTARIEILASNSKEDDTDESWNTLHRQDFVGHHAKQTSETYTETIKLPKNDSSKYLRLRITLVGGSTFKIMGLLVCR